MLLKTATNLRHIFLSQALLTHQFLFAGLMLWTASVEWSECYMKKQPEKGFWCFCLVNLDNFYCSVHSSTNSCISKLIGSNLDTAVKLKKPWTQLYWPTQCSKSPRITIAWLSSLRLLPAISIPWLDGTLPFPSVVINLWPWFQFSLWFHLQRWQ